MIVASILPLLIGVFVVAVLLAGWRLLRGPDLHDRILALDTLYINACALLILLGIRFDTLWYFDAVLLIGMLGFVGTVVLSKYLLRGNIID